MLKAILFDLDGTLLSMDNEEFIKYYFKLLIKKMAPLGFNGDALIKNIMMATNCVLKNDGNKLNRDVFFDNYFKLGGETFNKSKEELEALFDEFYNNEFNEAKNIIDDNPKINELLTFIRNNNLRIIIATTPVFPKSAVIKRISWLNENYEDFEYISTYENSHFAKPNPNYYLEILENCNLHKDEVIMVGNDMKDDIDPCNELNIKTFFLNNYPLNVKKDYKGPKGSIEELKNYICENM